MDLTLSLLTLMFPSSSLPITLSVGGTQKPLPPNKMGMASSIYLTLTKQLINLSFQWSAVEPRKYKSNPLQ